MDGRGRDLEGRIGDGGADCADEGAAATLEAGGRRSRRLGWCATRAPIYTLDAFNVVIEFLLQPSSVQVAKREVDKGAARPLVLASTANAAAAQARTRAKTGRWIDGYLAGRVSSLLFRSAIASKRLERC